MIAFAVYLSLASGLAAYWGFGLRFIIAYLITAYLCDFATALWRTRKRWGWLRNDYGSDAKRVGFGLSGVGVNNDGYFYFEWSMRQIYWRFPETANRFGVNCGVGLDPARAWLLIENGHRGTSDRIRASVHVYANQINVYRSKSV